MKQFSFSKFRLPSHLIIASLTLAFPVNAQPLSAVSERSNWGILADLVGKDWQIREVADGKLRMNLVAHFEWADDGTTIIEQDVWDNSRPERPWKFIWRQGAIPGSLTRKYEPRKATALQTMADGTVAGAIDDDYIGKYYEIRRTNTGIIATRYSRVGSGRKIIWTDEFIRPLPNGTYFDAANRANKYQDTEIASKRSSSPGFFGTLANAAMTAVEVATVSSYTGETNPNLYRGAAVDENSAQNQQFRANIARIAGTGNGSRGGSAPSSASGSGAGSFASQPETGSVRQPSPGGIGQASPATAVNSVRYFACSSVRRKILPDNSLAIASMSYGVVTSSRDSSDVAARFGQQTHTTGRIDGENGGSDCSGFDTREEAQAFVDQLVTRDRRGTFELITGVDFSW